MTTQFKIKPGQVFYIKTLLSEGNKYYPLEITRVTAKCVFFTFDGINRRGELKTDKDGNQYFTKYCPECLVGVYHHTPTMNPDEPTEVETIETSNNVVSMNAYRAKAETINPSANVEPQAIETTTNLETLVDSDTTETISTNPQDSTQELDRFEVVYQVADLDDEVSYESSKVYAYNHDHAKAIVSSALQAQHARYIITGCEYSLVIDDLSEFSLVDEF